MNADSRIYTLDAMRGVAAIMVVLYHLSDLAFAVAPGGYLAVDFFFALSGFVLARAYERPLQNGMPVKTFIEKRIIRLYPLFIIGVAFGVVKAASKALSADPTAPSLPAIAISLVLEAFMLPSPFMGEELFPLNGPAWSLFFELIINCIFAVLFVKLRSAWLYAICVLSGAVLAYATLRYGSLNIGWGWTTSWAGFARVTFSFCAGMLVARHGIAPSSKSGLFILPIIGLVIWLVMPVNSALRPIFDIASALLISPLLLVVGIALPPSTIFNRLCGFLGDISYPLYAIHFPILSVVAFMAKRLSVPPTLWAPVLIVGLVLLAWLLGQIVDPRLRGAMSRARA